MILGALVASLVIGGCTAPAGLEPAEVPATLTADPGTVARAALPIEQELPDGWIVALPARLADDPSAVFPAGCTKLDPSPLTVSGLAWQSPNPEDDIALVANGAVFRDASSASPNVRVLSECIAARFGLRPEDVIDFEFGDEARGFERMNGAGDVLLDVLVMRVGAAAVSFVVQHPHSDKSVRWLNRMIEASAERMRDAQR